MVRVLCAWLQENKLSLTDNKSVKLNAESLLLLYHWICTHPELRSHRGGVATPRCTRAGDGSYVSRVRRQICELLNQMHAHLLLR